MTTVFRCLSQTCRCAAVESCRSTWSSLGWNDNYSAEWQHVNLFVHYTQTSTFIGVSLFALRLITVMSNGGNEICGWVPPTSNSAPLLRMHDRCEWSIINGLGNELWMRNIICNRQLNMDRENIAPIAPRIVMCSTPTSRITIKQRVVFWLRADVRRERGWWEKWDSNIRIGGFFLFI